MEELYTCVVSISLLCNAVCAFSAPSSILPNNTQQTTTNTSTVHTDLDDSGFDLFFRTNKKQMRDVPVYFDRPVPTWLNGTLVRNGLGMFELGPRTFTHTFDGFAKLASWKFLGNGTVLFSTRFIKSDFYKESKQSHTIAPFLLFQSVSPPFGYFDRFKCLLRGIDNMNINIYEVRQPKTKKLQYAALSDFWIIYKININKLSTRKKLVPVIKNGAISSGSSAESLGFLNLLSSAHPLPEPNTSNHLTFLSSVAIFPWQSNKMNLIRIKSLKRRKVIASWTVDRLPYMHSFSVTQTKAIILASPFYVSISCMAVKAQPFSCVNWHPELPATLYIVGLRSGKVKAITIPSVFTMHHVNAYDVEKNKIVMDISSYPSPDFVRHLELAILRDPVKRNQFDAHARLKRITIDLDNNNASVENIGRDPNPGIASYLDMPVINEKYRSRHYCYIYGLVLKTDNITLSNLAVVKKDLCGNGKGDKVWRVSGSYPVEPWFVPTPKAVEEDDGILLVPVLRGLERKTYLVMLDAKSMTLLNEAQTPTVIPYSLHGRFFHSTND